MKKPLPIEFEVNGRRYEVKSLTDTGQTVKGKDKNGFWQTMTLKVGVSKQAVDRLFFGADSQ